MKVEFVDNNQRSRCSGLLLLNRLQLGLLSTLLFNLTMILWGTTARASQPALMEPAQSSRSAELTPVLPIDQPILTLPATAVLPTVAAVPVTPETPNQPDPLLQEATPTPAPITADEVAPTLQPISKQARDLQEASPTPSMAQTTLSQTENPTPTDTNSSTAKPVNNPLIPPPGWRFDFEPYLFVPLDVQGNIFIGRGRNFLFPNRPGEIISTSTFNLNVNANLSRITADLTNIFGISGRVQAWNGNFGVIADGLYVNSGFRNSSDGGTFTLRDRFNIPVPGFQIDTTNTLSSFSLGASYRLVTVPFRTITDPANPSQYYPAISVEALAGFRYLSVFQSVKFAAGPRFEFSGSEFNPMLGATVKLMLSKTFSLVFRGDTSNLGGNYIKQYYNLYGGIDWKFSGSFALRLSYRFNQIEFVKRGPLGGDNGLDLRTQGVQLGISWQF